MYFIEKVGQKYNRLVIQNQYRKEGVTLVDCLCDCGTEHTTRLSSLKNGICKSCGCYNSELSSAKFKTHGLADTKEYAIWCSIKGRVFGNTHSDKEKYRALGMDEDLAKDFSKFLDEVGYIPDYAMRYSIGRIDNSKGYTRGNMRWATPSEQSRNKTLASSNTTGVTGVSVNNARIGNNRYKNYVAHYTQLDGKLKCKYFSINKYGEDVAFKLACDYRESAIRELNKQGAGYTERHGK